MRLLLAIALMLASALPGLAQRDPTSGPNQFPQFRNLSGLAGSGYGVDIYGYRSLSGPVALSTPVAHTLGRGLVQLSGGALSFDSQPDLNGRDTNGSAFGTVGISFARFNLAGTFFVKSSSLDQVFNLQLQYIPDPGSKWVWSLGAQDIQGRGGASGESFPGDKKSSQSLFGVVTYRWDTPRSPIYISAGIGRHRFGRLFGSISHQILPPVRLWMESDGYGINYGILGAWRLGHGRRSSELTTSVGLIKGQYFIFSIGIGL